MRKSWVQAVSRQWLVSGVVPRNDQLAIDRVGKARQFTTSMPMVVPNAFHSISKQFYAVTQIVIPAIHSTNKEATT